MGLPCSSVGKEPAYNEGDPGLIPVSSSWKIPWRRKWQPTSVCLPGESHGQRGAWQAIVHGVARVRLDLASKPPPWGGKHLGTTASKLLAFY